MPGDPKRTRDVTKKVQQIADAGESSFEVPRLALGDDPAVNVLKTVVIDYSANGARLNVTGTDLDTVYLAPAPEVTERVAEVRLSDAGSPALEVWRSGRYDVTLASQRTVTVTAEVPAPVPLDGPWDLRFPPNLGAPEKVTLPKLASLSEHADAGVKYFSGTATYTKTFAAPATLLAGQGPRLSGFGQGVRDGGGCCEW